LPVGQANTFRVLLHPRHGFGRLGHPSQLEETEDARDLAVVERRLEPE